MNVNSPLLYIKDGILEPVHLEKGERGMMVKGLDEVVDKCRSESEIIQQ